jgi:hypothetical protein
MKKRLKAQLATMRKKKKFESDRGIAKMNPG